MSSISQSSLVNNSAITNYINVARQAAANTYSSNVIQISDQQSRDKEYEKGLEWIRSYIASLQAKVNTLTEEMNVMYEQMLNELMYKKADTNNTAKIPNAYTMPTFDTCLPYNGVAPNLNMEVRNFQYNPFFGSRSIDLDNFDMSDPTGNTIGRTYYEVDGQHHELGASFYSTLGYLWMWDVDRLNASYATTSDRYKGMVGNREVLFVSQNDPLFSQAENHPNIVNVNTGIMYDSMLDIVGSQGSDAKKYQVNITALQPNRGVFAPGVESKADEPSYALFEGFENSGVLKSLNIYDPTTGNFDLNTYNPATGFGDNLDDCKWTQAFVNPYDRDQGKMTEHLQWRIVNNRHSELDPNLISNASVFFGDPTGTNYNYEYYVVKDHVENKFLDPADNTVKDLKDISGPGFGEDYIDALSGPSGTQYNSQSTPPNQFEYSKLFDTYGIPKNYPDPDNPTIRFDDYPTNNLQAGDLTKLVKGGSSTDNSDYFNHGANVVVETVSDWKYGDTGTVKKQNASVGEWTSYYITDKRDTSDTLSSSWRVVNRTDPGAEAFSGDYAYYFGNIEGNYGTATMEAIQNDQSFTLSWNGQGDTDKKCSWKSPSGCWDTYDIPTFQILVNGNVKGSYKGNSGQISIKASDLINGLNSVQFKLANSSFDWISTGLSYAAMMAIPGIGAVIAALSMLGITPDPVKYIWGGGGINPVYNTNLKYERNGLISSSNYDRGKTNYNPSMPFDWGLGGEPVPHNNVWGHGYIDSLGNFVIPEYTGTVEDWDWNGVDATNEHNSINPGTLYPLDDKRSPGLKVVKEDYYRTEGFMTRKLDLSNMAGVDGSSFSNLELRYRQNFDTEPIGTPSGGANGKDNQSGQFDKRLALEYVSGTTYKELGIGPIKNSGVSYSSQRNDLRSSSNGWEQVYFDLNPGFGSVDQQVALYFDTVDQYQNKEYRGWSVDDIEVVARGKSLGELISPKIDLSQYQNATLEFDSRFISHTRDKSGTAPQKDNNDKISAYYSIDGGANWTLVTGSKKDGSELDNGANLMPNSFYNENDSAGSGTQYWTTVKLDLNCVAGSEDVRVKFVFQTDDRNNEGDGWNIDNVKVYGKKNAATDFYAYKQEIDDKFVVGSQDAPEINNKNRPNISFDPRGTNIKGRFDEGASSRVDISNTDFPIFSNTLLTYVEQDASTYNSNKVDSYAIWGAPNTPTPVAVLDNTVPGGLRVSTSKNTQFYRDSIGRLINSDGEMYIDRAMAINLGLVEDTKPTKLQIDNKMTGWVNYDETRNGLSYIDGTCFEEGTAIPGGVDTYQFMTTFVKKTVGLTAAEAAGSKSITIDVSTDAYLYINGEKIGGVSNKYGQTTYTIPPGKLKEGFNTIMLQHNYAEGPDGVKILSSDIAGIGSLDKTWSVRMYEAGYKGRDPVTKSSYGLGQDFTTGAYSDKLYKDEVLQYFGQQEEELKSFTLNFKNTDSNGVGILSTIQKIELVSTGEPTIQSFATKEFTTETINDNGPLKAVLNYGYIDGKQVLGDDPRAFNVAYKESLNFSTDINGMASIALAAKGGNSMVNDATVLMKVYYFDDEDQDGVIDIDTNRDGILDDTEIATGTASGKLKVKYIGAEDRRDKNYYTSSTVGHSGTLANSEETKVYDRFAIIGKVKLASNAPINATSITLTTSAAKTSTNSNDGFIAGDEIEINGQKLNVGSVTGNTINFLPGQKLNAAASAGTTVLTNSYTGISDKQLKTDTDYNYAYNVYNNLITASKGRSGGADVEGNKNKLSEKLKSVLDSKEYQEVLKYGLLDNVIIAATSNSSRGDQVVGKIILDWDWRKRRVKVTQGSFSAVYKS